MDSELTVAVAAALDPILLFVGLAIGAAVLRWSNRLALAAAIIIVTGFLFGFQNEPWATIGRGVGVLIGISIGDWLRNRRKRAQAR